MVRSNRSTKVEKMFVLSKRACNFHTFEKWKSVLSDEIQRQLFQFSAHECLTTFIKDFLEEIMINFDLPHQKAAIEVLHEELLNHREHHEEYIDEIDYVICQGKLDDSDVVFDKLNEMHNSLTSQCSLERQCFVDALKAVRFAMGTYSCKPYYNGIFLVVSKGKMCCYAGNGARFAVKQAKSTLLKANKKIKVFLPIKSINRIINSLDAISSPIVNVASRSKEQTCVITADNLNLRIENIPDYEFPPIDKVLNYDFPHKLCITVNDLKWHIAHIRAAVKSDNVNFPKPVDISIDNCSRKLVLRYGSTSLGTVPLSIDSVIPDATNSSFTLRCFNDYLAEICKHWPGQTEIAIYCEMNGSRPILVAPKNKQVIRSNELDITFFASSRGIANE